MVGGPSSDGEIEVCEICGWDFFPCACPEAWELWDETDIFVELYEEVEQTIINNKGKRWRQ